MKAHGNFEIQRRRRIVQVQLRDGFNLEGAQALMGEIKRVSAALAGGSWAILYDLRGFLLATPEVMSPWMEFSNRTDARDRTHVAVVAEGALMQSILESYADGVSAKISFFRSQGEAMAWLSSLGFE